jgi:hypothetical protein
MEELMADRVLFVVWNQATPGREKQAAQLLKKLWNFIGNQPLAV